MIETPSTTPLRAQPDAFMNSAELEQSLSEPTDALVEAMRRIDGPILILGVGGKMGPTLARMIRRADEASGVSRDVIGVSRFGSGDQRDALEACGIQTIAADLLEHGQIESLPDAPNVIYMAGFKFGVSADPSKAWAMNVLLPGMVCRRYARSRIVAFSSGNVYPKMPLSACGSVETDPPGPLGEYAMSCLGRERAFEYYSRSAGTPVALIRLSYACELRYGVLVDIASAVWAGDAVDISNTCFRVIWQADANEMSLRALEHTASPPTIFNITGPELLSIRRVAERFGQLMDRPVMFKGIESDKTRLTNAQHSHRLFGYPRVGVDQMIHWIADWIMRGGENLGKPTHYEVNDGKY